MNKIPFNVLKDRPNMVAGAVHTKDTSTDDKIIQDSLSKLTTEMSAAKQIMEKTNDNYAKLSSEMLELKKSVPEGATPDAETKAKLDEYGVKLGEALADISATKAAMDNFKKDLDNPMFGSQKDLQDHDRKTAIELQKRIHEHKYGAEKEFKADLDNLINPEHVRSAMMKMTKVGIESKAEARSRMTTEEQKAFDNASLDSGFFMPEILGIELDCFIECAEMLDLYSSVTVPKSAFMYPHVTDWGEIGRYDCDALCDAEFGPEGNITWKGGRTYDFRGVFCLQRDVVREADYDILGFMFRAAARSYRINRNAALINGDGKNEPLGWLRADCFTKVQSGDGSPDHRDLRMFLASHPVEYGAGQAIMHQNTFSYFASQVDNNGRFIFGDGMMGYSPSDVAENIRISNCLPDPTVGLTRGSNASPFATGAFIMAYGSWSDAYYAVNQRPMFMEQFIGGSTAWCVKYQFGAKDGGFVGCCPAARTWISG